MPSRQDRSRGHGRDSQVRGGELPSNPSRGLELEALEPRVLLTTLVGGDVFEYYVPEDDVIIRVKVTGDTIVELIGTAQDNDNEPVLGHMPGVWIQSDVGRAGESALGGLGGIESGVVPVNGDTADGAPTGITDPDWAPYSIPVLPDGEDNENITIEAIASRDAEGAGDTYGFNVAEVDDRLILQLVLFDTPDQSGDGQYSGDAVVEAMLQSATLREDSFDLDTAIETVEAFTNDPTDVDTGYAINTDGELYSIDLTDGTTSLVGEVEDTGGDALEDISAMVVDDNGDLFALSADYDGDANSTHLLQINKSTAAVEDAIELLDGADNPVAAAFNGLTLDDNGDLLATSHDGVNTTLHRLSFPSSTEVLAEVEEVYAGVLVQGVTHAQNLDGDRVLVGVDHSQGDGPRLIELGEAGAFTVLNEAGTIADVSTLSAVELESGERPVLFSTNGTSMIRGSNVSLLTGAGGESLIEAIEGASFRPDLGDPNDGLLYFVARDGDGGQYLYTIDATAETRSQIQGSLEIMGQVTGLGEANITTIAWDQVDDDEAELWGFADDGRLVELDPTSGTVMDSVVLDLLNEEVTGITGLSVINDDPNAEEEFFYGVDGEEGQLVQIARNGDVFVLNVTPDPTDALGAVRGEALESLSWNSTAINPFTGDRGVLMATDVESDELVFVDHRFRPGASGSGGNLFAMYVSQGSADSSISISMRNEDPPFDMLPWEGSAGSWRVVPVGGGDVIEVGAPDESGTLLVGARTIDIIEGVDDDLFGRVAGELSDSLAFGTRIAGLDDLPDDDDNNVSAGVRIVESLIDYVSTAENMGDRLMGNNIDAVEAMAVARDGSIVVVDGDNVNADGNIVPYQELTMIDPVTGQATGDNMQLVDINGPLDGLVDLTYADLTFDGDEELYALVETSNGIEFGTISFVGNQARFFPSVTVDPAVVRTAETMAIHPSASSAGGVYLIGLDAGTGARGLYKLDTSTGDASLVGHVDREIVSMDFGDGSSGDRRLLGHDLEMGRLVDIDYTNVVNDDVVIGQQVQTSVASLRPTVGAIAYDSSEGRFLASDNATSHQRLSDESDEVESAVLMELAGVESDSAVPQDMDRIFIAGTVLGRVESAGSIDTMYVGWLAVGNILGQVEETSTAEPNFEVAGDLRNLVTVSTIGSVDEQDPVSPEFLTGFHMYVGGRVGEIFTPNEFFGQIQIENEESAPGLHYSESIPRELEGRLLHGDVPGLVGAPFLLDESNFTEGFLFEDLHLWRADGVFNNDTFDTAQRLGSTEASLVGDAGISTVFGRLAADGDPDDHVDYYAVPLLAGQTVDVQLFHDLLAAGSAPLRVGVFDPDGRLVYTDYNTAGGVNEPFQFTADRPGEYRFAVAFDGDTNFNGEEDGDEGVSTIGAQATYLLQVQNVGNVALGGLVADNATLLGATGLRAGWGDLGAVHTQNTFAHLGSSSANSSLWVERGSLRSIEIGVSGTDTLNEYLGNKVNIYVDQGDVGLLRSTEGPLRVPELIVGGNVQVIDATVDFNSQLEANGGIGIIRADNMTDLGGASTIEINANGNTGNFIGLIDIEGDLDSAALVTNDGGDVRYMRVGGTATSPNGGNVAEPHDGPSYSYSDDAGTEVRFHARPLGDEATDVNGDPINDHTLTTRIYPLVNANGSSGGSVLIDVVSTGGLNVEVINTPSGVADVYLGTLIVNGEGRAVLVDGEEETDIEVDEETGLVTQFERDGDFDQDDGDTDLEVVVTNRSGGDAKVNIFGIEGDHFSLIDIRTRGELVNVTAESVWELKTHGNLGVAEQVYGSTLVAHPAAANTPFSQPDVYPFRQQTTGIDIAGHAWWISAREALGNVHVGGDLFGIIANSNHSAMVSGEHFGINAPIYVQGHADQVNIGHGILPSGSGDVGFSGVFVTGELDRIHNGSQPAGSDIRGIVNAGLGIDRLQLHNGSIIDTFVSAVLSTEEARTLSTLRTLVFSGESTFETPIEFLGDVRLTGNGGIIGSQIVASQIGDVSVEGFGVLNSSFSTLGRIDSITAGGFGIHSTIIDSRSSIGDIEATGRGDVLDVTDYSFGVRQSEDLEFDPYSGRLLGLGNDLHQFMGTDVDESAIEDVTVAGMLRDIQLYANRTLDSLSGFRMEATSPLVPNIVDIGDALGTLSTIDSLSDLYLTAGKLDRFQPGGDVMNAEMRIAGEMRSFHVRGDFGENSVLRLVGPDAGLNSFRVDGDMEGDLVVEGVANRVMIGGDLIGSIQITAPEDTRRYALGNFSLGGTMYGGSFNVVGDVGTIRADGSLGDPNNPLAAEQIVIDGDLNRMDVGRGRDYPGSMLAMDLVVLGDLRSLNVTGRIVADIDVSGDLNSLMVRTDDETGLSAAPAPSLAMAGLSDGMTDIFDVRAVTVGDDGQLYILHYDDDADEHQLYTVPRLANGEVDTSGATMQLVGTLTHTDPNTSITSEVDDIQAMEFNRDDGLIYLAGSAAGGNLTLYAFNPAAGTSVSSVGEIRANGSALSGTQSVRGLSYDDRRETLYAVIHDTAAGSMGTDTLVTLDTSSANGGTVEELGQIRVGDIDTNVAGMDLVHDRHGARLIAIDNDADVTGDGRVIEINVDDPINSQALSASGTVSDGVRGYGSDDEGNFYAVRFDNTQPNPTQLVQSNYNAIEGFVQVGGDLNRVSVQGGHLDADVQAGGSINQVQVRDGDFAASRTITAVLGDIRSVRVQGGDLHGNISAVEGSVQTVQVTHGSDLGGSIEAGDLRQLRLDGSMLATSSVDVEGVLDRLDVRGDVDAGATIEVGGLGNARISGDFAGEMESGYYDRSTSISISENFTGEIISNGSDTRFDVRGHFGYDDAGDVAAATLLVGRDLSSLRVNGDTVGQITVNGATRSMQFQGDLGHADHDTVVTGGFGIDMFRVSGDMDRTLLQTGVGAGRDLAFGTGDTRELTRLAELGRFDANRVTNSVIAAGGDISNFRVNEGMADSSVSAGMVLNHDAIADLLGGALALNSDGDRNSLRTDVDLYHGSFSNLQVNGDGVSNSFISAGVDPVDGDFLSSNTLLTSQTGGQSGIRSLTLSSIDADSAVVTDSGVERQRIDSDGGATFEQVTYDIADVAPDLDPNDLFGTVSQNNPLEVTVGSETVLFDLRGDGEVDVYVSGGQIETIVLRGTDSRARLTIEAMTGSEAAEPGSVTIDRVLSEDDATVGHFDMTGINLGTTADPALVDFWLDGEVNSFSFHAMSEDADWTGRIGGDVRSFDLHTQGAGRLMIGGEVSRLTVADSSGISLLGAISDAPVGPGDLSTSIQELAVNSIDGMGYVFDEALGLVRVDVDNGSIEDGPHHVLDAYSEQLLALNGMDFDDAVLLGATEAHSYQPVVNVGTLADEAVSLVSLAVDHSTDGNGDGDRDDVIYAIENSGYFEIDAFDTEFDAIVGTAWVSDDVFYMVNQDDNGTTGDTSDDSFELFRVERAADGLISDVASVGTIAEGGTDVFDIDALEYDIETQNLLVTGRTDVLDDQQLFSVDTDNAEADNLNAIPQDGASDPTNRIQGLAFRTDPNDPSSRTLYAVAQEDDGSGGIRSRLLEIERNSDGEILDATDLGLIELDGEDTEISGIMFDHEGHMIAQNVDDQGRHHRIRVDLADPTQSQRYSRPDGDPEDILDIGGDVAGDRGLAIANDSDGVTRLYGFNAIADRLVQIDAEDGSRTVVGQFVNSFSNQYYNSVEHIAFAPDGSLFALLNDRDGIGDAYMMEDGAALARVDLSATPNGDLMLGNPDPNVSNSLPALIDADPSTGAIDPLTDPFGGLAVSSSNQVYTVYKSSADGDTLLEIGTEYDGSKIEAFAAAGGAGDGEMLIDGDATDVIGIGFDIDGNLLALNRDGDASEIISLAFGFDAIEQEEADGAFDGGTFVNANPTDLQAGRFVTTNGMIGDNFGSVYADYDVFHVEADAGDVISAYVAANGSSDDLLPRIAIYDDTGSLVDAANNSSFLSEERLQTTVGSAGDYYIVVGGLDGSPIPATYDDENVALGSSTGGYRAAFGLNAPDAAAFERTSIPQLLDGGLDAFAVGGSGNASDTYAYDLEAEPGGTFYASAGAAPALGADRVPTNLLGSIIGSGTDDLVPGAGLGDVYDVRALAIGGAFNDGDRYFAVTYNDSAENYELIRIHRDGPHGAVSDVSSPLSIIDERLPGPNAVQDIHAAAGNHLGEVYIVGTAGSSSTQQLYRLDVSTGEAVPVGELNDGRPIDDSIVALAFSGDSNELFGVRQTEDGQQLLRIDPSTGDAEALGMIQIDGAHTQIHSFDFGDDGNLYGIEHTRAGSRVVQVDIDDPSTSSAATSRGEVNDNLVGYAAQSDGTFFSIYNDGAVNTQLWSSNDDDRASIFGIIDESTGDFTQMMPLLDADEQLLGSRLLDITVDEDNDRIYSLTVDGRVFEHSATDGRFIAEHGRIISDAGDGELRVTSIEYDSDTGRLLGIDTRFNQMVQINLADATDTDGDGVLDVLPASGLGESGSINGYDIANMAYDADNERLLAVTRGANPGFARFLDTDDATLGGFYAESFRSVDITVPEPDNGDGVREFPGRFVATGSEGFNSVRVDGDFTGTIVSAGEIRRFDVRGDYGGSLQAWDDINSISIDGDVYAGSTITTSDELRSFRLNSRDDVYFAGVLDAEVVNSIDIRGSVLDSASITVDDNLSRLRVHGNFEGQLNAGSLDNFDVQGELGSQARINIDDDVRSMNLRGGTASGSMVYVDGSLNSLRVDGTHRGTIATLLDISRASMGDVDRGLIAAGTNIDNIQVDNLTNSVISAGVWLGKDLTYNTDDDVIFGGSITRSVMVRGDMTSSVIAAGVLPNRDSEAADGSPNLPVNTRSYIGYNLDRPGMPETFVDDAEAGGMLPSSIGMVSVRGGVTTSGSVTVDGGSVLRQNVVVAADEIDRLNGNEATRLHTRAYSDVYGAPTVENVSVVDDHTFDVVFSEEVNTSSLILSEDNTGDGEVDGVADTLGTIVLRDEDGNVIDDVDLVYRTETDNRGKSYGVLRVIRQDGFGDMQLTIEVSGGGDGAEPAVFDRSGGRSFLRNPTLDSDHTLEAAFGGSGMTNFDVDRAGTILDGNLDGSEGGVAQFIRFFGDAPSSFTAAEDQGPVMEALGEGEDYNTASVGNFFTSAGDVDVYQFTANAYDFFSIAYEGEAPATLAVFLRDPNSVGDPDDDTYEALARYEDFLGEASLPEGASGPGIFQALELPSLETESGSDLDLLDINGVFTGTEDARQTHGLEFYVVVAPAFYNATDNNNYTLDFTLASSDDMLDGQFDGQAALPQGEQIGYISNAINDGSDPSNERGNYLGYNDPRQVVYLDFGGSVSERIDLNFDGRVEDISFDPFDASVLDPSFEGIANVNDLLINGNGDDVTGIIDHVLSIYKDTPATHPFGTLNVDLYSDGQDFDAAYNAPGASGLFFTTVNPEQYGLTAGEDFSTMYIGEADVRNPTGVYGLAQDIDLANMNKGLDVVVTTQTFANTSFAADTTDRLNDYSLALGNVIAHELGHILGLNHSGLSGNPLIPDSPSNDFSQPQDFNLGISTMGSGATANQPDDLISARWRFGTAETNGGEFPMGQIDYVDLLLRWLGSES